MGQIGLKIRGLALLLSLTLCLSSVALAAEKRPEDPDYIHALALLNILRGDEAGQAPHRLLTRGEAAVLLVRLLGEEATALSCADPCPFPDGNWAAPYLTYAAQKGLVKGRPDGSFGGGAPTDTVQFSALLLRALGYDDGPEGQFAYADAAAFAGLVLGTDRMPSQLTRQEAARLLWLTLETRQYGSSRKHSATLLEKGSFTPSDYARAGAAVAAGEKKPKSTTLLVYMVASDLETAQGRATADLEEMLDAAEGEGLQIVLQAGGTKDWRNPWMTDGKSQRFLLGEDALVPLAPPDDAPMCQPETLEDFLRFGAEQYPADRYLLLLWDHGEGTQGGFGRDELHEGKSLRLWEIRQALERARVRPEAVIMDACLMGTMEMAYALRGLADYLVAAEDLTPAAGLYYTTWLDALAASPAIATSSLCALMADSFLIRTQAQPQLPPTLSVVRLDRVEALYRETKALLCAAPLPTLQAALARQSALGEQSGAYDQFDLALLARALGGHRAEAALHAAVPHLRCSDPEKTRGLAIYLPRDQKPQFSAVNRDLAACGFDTEYLNRLQALWREGDGV